jgi:hypothetical protein
MTDITGGITDQTSIIAQQTGIGPVFTSVGNGLMDVFQTGVQGFKTLATAAGNIANGLGKALSGDTLNLVLLCALGGVVVYGISELGGSKSRY